MAGERVEGLRRLIADPRLPADHRRRSCCVHRPARLRPRARPLSRRPLFGVKADAFSIGFGREIAGLDRQARHALEARLAAARRLCEVRRRHEPGEPADRRVAGAAAPRSARRPSRPSRCGSARSSSLAGPVDQFPARDPDPRRLRARLRRADAPRPSSARSTPAAPRPAAGLAAGRPDHRARRPRDRRLRRHRDATSRSAPGEPVAIDVDRGGERDRARDVAIGTSTEQRPVRQRLRASACSASGRRAPVDRAGRPARGARRRGAPDRRHRRDDGRRRWARSSPAAARSRNSAGRSASPRFRASRLTLGWLDVRLADRAASRLIWDSSTCCQSRCWMAATCCSTRSRRSGGGRSTPQVQEWAFRAGLAAILALMLFVTFNDLGSFGLWSRLGRLDRLTHDWGRAGGTGRTAGALVPAVYRGRDGDSDRSVSNGRGIVRRAPAGGTMLGGVAAPAQAQTAPAPRRAGRAAPPAARQAAPARQRRRRRAGRAHDQARSRVEGIAAARARDGALLHQAARRRRPTPARRSIRRCKDLYATDLFADVVDRRRRDRRHRASASARTRSSTASSSRATSALKDDKITQGDQARAAPDLHPLRGPRRTSRGSSSCIAARAASPRRSSRRWSASTRTASTSCSRSTKGRSPRSARSTSSATSMFSDGKLRGADGDQAGAPATASSARAPRYDQDRLAYDQQKLRQFYLTQGYADFRVVSAVAELTPDKKDFIITYVVEEGPALQVRRRHRRQRHPRFRRQQARRARCRCKKGDWYNAKQVEDTVDQLNETAGLFGYAFADVEPELQPRRRTR